jgi:hypothetical protein
MQPSTNVYTLKGWNIQGQHADTNQHIQRARAYIQAWQQASLASWGARPEAVQSRKVTAKLAGEEAITVHWAVNGPARQVHSLWFARDGWVYQTAVYAPMQDRSVEAVADTYFSGIAQP